MLALRSLIPLFVRASITPLFEAAFDVSLPRFLDSLILERKSCAGLSTANVSYIGATSF
jgi:hypothetical protein